VGIGSEEVPFGYIGVIGFYQPECQLGATKLYGVQNVVGRLERPGLWALVLAAVGDHGGGVDLAKQSPPMALVETAFESLPPLHRRH